MMRQLGLMLGAACAATLLFAAPASAQKKYDPGATDTEIKIGMTAPLSGPASAYGVACPVTEGFFSMINDQGGINGRKLKLLCEDDGFSPPKAVEQTRKLVEGENVLFIYNTLGTAVNTAIQRYLTAKKVPQLLISSGASKWNDPKSNPWTISSLPHYSSEAVIFADYLLKNKPDAKIGLLYQNDDFGKDYQRGLKTGLGVATSKMLTAEVSYEVGDPTIDSQIIELRSKGVDVVVVAALAKQTSQALRKMGELGWKPQVFVSYPASSITAVLAVAGLDNAKGVMSTAYLKDPSDPRWAGEKDVVAYKAFMAKYYPKGDTSDIPNIILYATANVLVDVLKRSGDDLTRSNVMKQATSIDIAPPMYLPGVRFKTTPTDFDPVKRFQMNRFDGQRWVQVGEPIGN